MWHPTSCAEPGPVGRTAASTELPGQVAIGYYVETHITAVFTSPGFLLRTLPAGDHFGFDVIAATQRCRGTVSVTRHQLDVVAFAPLRRLTTLDPVSAPRNG